MILSNIRSLVTQSFHFGTDSLRSTDALKRCNPGQAKQQTWTHSSLSSYIDDEAKLDDKDTLDKKSSVDGDKMDGGESGQLTPPPKSVSNDNEIGAIFILI